MLFDTRRSEKDTIFAGCKLHKITLENIDALRNRMYKLDVSCVNFEQFLPYYMNVGKYETNNYYGIIDGYICIFRYMSDRGLILCTDPIGPLDFDRKLSVIKKCVKLMDLTNGSKFDVRCECFTESAFACFNPDRVKCVHFCEEMVYRTADLCALAGKPYKSVRHAVNSFERNEFVFRAYDKTADFEAAKELYLAWKEDYEAKQEADEHYGENGGANDEIAYTKYLEYPELCGLSIYVCYMAGKMAGIVGITRLCKNSSAIIFEKCDNSIPNISEYLWIRVLREYDKYEYEDDGDGGTRKADGSHVSGLYAYKMRFRPEMVRPMYLCDVRDRRGRIYNTFFARHTEG